MAGRYQCSEEEIKAIEQKRKGNKDKRGENSSGRRVMTVSRISACSSGVSSRCVPFWNPRFYGSR